MCEKFQDVLADFGKEAVRVKAGYLMVTCLWDKTYINGRTPGKPYQLGSSLVAT